MKAIHSYWGRCAFLAFCLLATTSLFLSGFKTTTKVSVSPSITNTVVVSTNYIFVREYVTNTVVLIPANPKYLINSNTLPMTITNFLSINVTNTGMIKAAFECEGAENPDPRESWSRLMFGFVDRHFKEILSLIGVFCGIIGGIKSKKDTAERASYALAAIFAFIFFIVVIVPNQNGVKMEQQTSLSQIQKTLAEHSARLNGMSNEIQQI
jgi:hypothetical protein